MLQCGFVRANFSLAMRLAPALSSALPSVVRPLSSVLERVRGIEPPSSAWKAAALPLSYTRKPGGGWWRGLDSNQRRLSQRIYSPSPLTTRAPLRIDLRGALG